MIYYSTVRINRCTNTLPKKRDYHSNASICSAKSHRQAELKPQLEMIPYGKVLQADNLKN